MDVKTNTVAGCESLPEPPEGSSGVLRAVFSSTMDNAKIRKGLSNLSTFPPFDIKAKTPAPYKGKPFTPAEIGLVNYGKEIKVALAAEGALPRYITPEKFVAMIEFADNPKYATVELQSPKAPADRRDGLGQLLGRVLPDHSAINIAMGNQGVPIRNESDILRIDSFQIDAGKLAAYYLVCRYQIMGEDRLADLIAGYEGARYFELPDGKSGVSESISNLLG
ncbi:hypothetical protein HTZ97_07320 [Desulfuromonas acetoxidans]|uniref:Uncharacterized protein n=1 Tax=Desulfuromonas acetoxidans (strain DSM 684 / 11070) TaxID=281689 RepID=Q1K3K5_DESA6|nr:hypothetical protein [Desulfuromonas acetoxidans]EAT16969.1 hypothetical protein Dace_2835 [Desulfuromonas acetoxidans DSM 684]MBF0644500.1 hypothetical protein [Desulfuromonas acetoxidans]NVD23973.1 hypothetical protein [Desulfuromonas acetoxidans]NVE16270.1 hypothetical protein [Desulfuromonas acetoxidans]